MDAYLGLDIGSVTIKIAVLDAEDNLLTSLCMRTQGQPIRVIQQSLRQIESELPAGVAIKGVGTTGSARYLAGVMVGADVIKNEITAHAVASS
ncbi:MAG: 2-hydroxyglutaryl-CoA dehydratase, partial [Dehalococcoidia bacterium]|nr:2-hydroxyglutaryl-CoA dehydratase [Dehalococcoidia bacterium]